MRTWDIKESITFWCRSKQGGGSRNFFLSLSLTLQDFLIFSPTSEGIMPGSWWEKNTGILRGVIFMCVCNLMQSQTEIQSLAEVCFKCHNWQLCHDSVTADTTPGPWNWSTCREVSRHQTVVSVTSQKKEKIALSTEGCFQIVLFNQLSKTQQDLVHFFRSKSSNLRDLSWMTYTTNCLWDFIRFIFCQCTNWWIKLLFQPDSFQYYNLTVHSACAGVRSPYNL